MDSCLASTGADVLAPMGIAVVALLLGAAALSVVLLRRSAGRRRAARAAGLALLLAVASGLSLALVPTAPASAAPCVNPPTAVPTPEPTATPTPAPTEPPAPSEYPATARFLYFHGSNLPVGSTVVVERIWDSWNNCVLESVPLNDRREFVPDASGNIVDGMMYLDEARGGSCSVEPTKLHWRLRVDGAGDIGDAWEIHAERNPFSSYFPSVCELANGGPRSGPNGSLECRTEGHDVRFNDPESWQDFVFVPPGQPPVMEPITTLPAPATT